MGHHHNHEHHHHHHHGPANYGMAFAVGILLNSLFIIVEIVYGFLSDSVALIADAGHNISDVLGLIIAWGAIWLSKKAPTANRTYGMKRSSVLAALFNAVFLLIAIGAIAFEAIQKFSHPEPVVGKTVILVALIGIIVNGITAFLFMSGRKSDLNIRGAYLHMASDALVSFGVVIAGIIIILTGWNWIDPFVSVIIAIFIFMGTWSLLKEAINLSLDAVPQGISTKEIYQYLKNIPSVVDLHDLHVWGLSTSEAALTVHLIRNEIEDNDILIKKITKELHDQYHIEHATIQIEQGSVNCSPCS